ncbi:carbohydrate ABC transporter permease [Phytoactinopolyspora halotolerans]|uniref:Carbohydrate ABC transporter permease n=1 Tax=Phytoactinopolyspora halotolerans TaxID=1981512 RepID=A0A6L9SB23_9ACTN|nr:carbohydrate ABC transporter permease [Phytoactinopolyspora halotolerans]NEE01708.1 carbohydrate ABC transporter permease [Phytoactinopolyspora halotolerans]
MSKSHPPAAPAARGRSTATQRRSAVPPRRLAVPWRRWRPSRAAAWLILIVLMLVTLLPFYWIVRTAATTNSSLFTGDQSFLPPEPTWVNFERVLGLSSTEEAMAAGGSGAEFDFLLYLRNSVIVSVLITVGQVTFCAMAAYAFARLQWRGREAVFYVFLAALLIPPVFIVIPNFVLLNQLGLLDTFAALAAPYFFVTPFMVFFLRQFFLGISTEMEEAARIDGAGHPRIFLQIDVPIMSAPLSTAAILAYVIAWNEFMWPLVAGSDESVRVLTVGLSLFRAGQPQAGPDWTGLMAATCLGAVPVILLFLVMGRRIVDSIQFTGLR